MRISGKLLLFRLLVPFVAGILCYDQVRTGGLSGGVALIVTCIILLNTFLLRKADRKLYQNSLLLLLMLVMLASGYALSFFGDVRNSRSWFGHTIDRHRMYLVVVSAEPAEKTHSWKMPVSLVARVDSAAVQGVMGKALLYLNKDKFPPRWHAGDTLMVPGNWEPIHNAGNPAEFDYAVYCRRNNICFRQFCAITDTRLYAAGDSAAMPVVMRAHNWCMHQLDKYLPDKQARGLVQAMLLGDDVNLDPELRQSWSETGIVHILAISGGHVLVLFGVISSLLFWLKSKKQLWIKYAVALPPVWFYVVMAGAPPSAVRAAVMVSIFAGGLLLQRERNSLNYLMAAAFVLLCAQPMWLFSVGFCLSFVAVLSLILFYTRIYRLLAPRGLVARALWGTIVASLSAEILVAPLVIYYFHIFPLLFLLANVVAALFMSLVLYMSMAIIVLSSLSSVAGALGAATIWLVHYFNLLIAWMQSCNPVSFHYLVLTGPELLLLYFIIGSVAYFLINGKRSVLLAGLGGACLLLFALTADQYRAMRQQRLVVYNTGKANYIEWIRGRHYTVLRCDTGTNSQADYAARAAHTAWNAWRKDSTTENSLLQVGDQLVWIMDSMPDTSIRFRADYVVVNYTGKADAAALKKICSPRMVIVGNNYNHWQQAGWQRSCQKAGIAVHCTGTDGAFVLQ